MMLRSIGAALRARTAGTAAALSAALASAVAVTAAVSAAGCGESPKATSQSVRPAPVVPKKAVLSAAPPADALKGDQVLEKEVFDSGAGLQVKSIPLLRSSLLSCTSGRNTTVSCEMHIVAGGGPPAGCATAGKLSDGSGRRAFLLSSRYPAASDVIDVEAPNLYDPRRASRSGTGADELTDSYLRALGVIADVVAHNCDVNGDCDCSTQAKAEKLVARCFPGFDPGSSRMKQTSMILFGACSSANQELRRKAIASMLASYAFAAAR